MASNRAAVFGLFVFGVCGLVVAGGITALVVLPAHDQKRVVASPEVSLAFTTTPATSSSPSDVPGNGPASSQPFATLPPSHGRSAPTCATVYYAVTKKGVEVDVTVADAEYVMVEADDAQDNPVGGDTTKASGDWLFKAGALHHVIVIAGVKTLDHVNVLPPGNSYDACNAYRR